MPRRVTIASASLTEGTSRATIRRSRASKATLLKKFKSIRGVYAISRAISTQARKLGVKQIGGAGVGDLVHFVEGLIGAGDRDLFEDHQRAPALFENLPQRHQAGHAAICFRRRRGDGEDPPLERCIGRVAALAARDIQSIAFFKSGGIDARIIRTSDKDAMMRLRSSA